MRYVVTGGAGFIGSHLVERLLQLDQEVVVLDDFSTGRRENLLPFLNRINLVEGSITDPGMCARAVEGADFVLHQAALPSVPRSIADPEATHEVCSTGTLNVLVAAKDAGVRRIVYAGSSSAYGDTPVLPKRESMRPQPRSPYAVAKLAGENYCRAFYFSYGLETVALRYFNVFGPRQDPDSPYGAVVPKFLSAAESRTAPRIFGDGEQTRDFTFVANVVRANLLACKAPITAVGRCFNIGCGERVSINRLWQLVQELSGMEISAEYAPARAGDVRDSLASIDDASEHLGYHPGIDLRNGLALTLKAFRANLHGISRVS